MVCEGAGGGESGLINTLASPSDRIDHPNEHQMKSELHIFSSSDIGRYFTEVTFKHSGGKILF